jgi:hypothetical protein
MANYWWVNQNQTYMHEVRGGYLWSPKVNANGARNQFYENMKRVEPGDVVFSFCDTYIKAIGVCVSKAESVPKPTARSGPVQSDSFSGFLSNGSAVQAAAASGNRLKYAASGVCRSSAVCGRRPL